MSTRCNIIVRNPDCCIILYRHCDGYPADCGADLAEAIRASDASQWHSGVAHIVNGLLDLRYDKENYEPKAKAVYEITDSIHGDIEWLYEIAPDAGMDRRVRVAERPRGQWDDESWVNGGQWYSLAQFIILVNADRREFNRRLANLAARKVAQPGAPYGDEYPMLAIQSEQEAA